MEFFSFRKISRLSREMIVTEKLDGTNAQIFIRELPDHEIMPTETPIVAVVGKFLIYAGSRTRWITPESDNYNFAKWVKENAKNISLLGPGSHFGEWWGSGIQRNYGLKERRFSLFNTDRWADARPSCCDVVPTIYKGEFDTQVIEDCVDCLRVSGSVAAPGFMKPEGVVVLHVASGNLYKKTLENDEKPKGKETRHGMG